MVILQTLQEKLIDFINGKSASLIYAVKSALAAGIAWEIAMTFFGQDAASFSVVSAIVITQLTTRQTLRKGIERIIAVACGVSFAVLAIHFFGLHVWTVIAIIFFMQFLGIFVKEKGPYLATQMPISAGLALILVTTRGNYPLLRTLGAVIGAITGVLVSIIISPPIYVSKAQEAFRKSLRQVADIMNQVAKAIESKDVEKNKEVYAGVRKLEKDLKNTEQKLILALDSTHLSPWSLNAKELIDNYPEKLLTVDKIVRKLRRIAYTVSEAKPNWGEMSNKQKWVTEYAVVLKELATIVTTFSKNVRAKTDAEETKQSSVSLEKITKRIMIYQKTLIGDTQAFETKRPTSSAMFTNQLVIRGALLTDFERLNNNIEELIIETKE